MSKWIRNRKRTDWCPKKLIGKKADIRHRDGSITESYEAEFFNESWNTSDNSDSDIMAYRIIEDEQAVTEKTPYQQLCEKYGVAEDAYWVTEDNEQWSLDAGIVATIKHDDGTHAPIFYAHNAEAESFYIPVESLRPYKDPAKIAPKLWNAYKDVLNDEALAALRDAICEQWEKVGWDDSLKARDEKSVCDAFYWAYTTQGTDFWADVYEGKYNKPTTALELQDAEIGIPEPVDEVIGTSVAGHTHRGSDKGSVTMPVGPSIEELVAGGFLPALKPNDMVNHPPHYTQGGIECIDAIKSALTEEEYRGYCKGNALKYIWREKHKGGNESLQKANWYLDRIAK